MVLQYFFFFFFLKLFYEHDYNTFVLQYNKAMVRDLLIYLHMFRALCHFFWQRDYHV